MIERLQEFTASLPTVVQWLAVVLAGAVPFVESYLGAAIGVVAGVAPPVAVIAAVVGNVASMLVAVRASDALRERLARGPGQLSAQREKLRKHFDRFGVPGVSLLGQTVLPSQITAAALVSFGAPKATVIRWQVISIVLWGVVFGTLAAVGIDLLAGR